MFLKIALEMTTIKMTLTIQRIAAPTQVKHPSPSLLCRPESFSPSRNIALLVVIFPILYSSHKNDKAIKEKYANYDAGNHRKHRIVNRPLDFLNVTHRVILQAFLAISRKFSSFFFVYPPPPKSHARLVK